MKLYTYFRSSAAYRVRIALNLKSLGYETIAIHLQKDGGRNKRPEFRAINPLMRVPALALDSGEVLTQSLAIIEYLDEIHPQPPLLPRDPVARAKARALAQLIACDIHPLNNVSPLRYLKSELGQDQSKIDAWLENPAALTQVAYLGNEYATEGRLLRPQEPPIDSPQPTDLAADRESADGPGHTREAA